MKKSLIIITALASLTIPALCAAAAPARPGAYVSGFLGATMPTESSVTSSDFISGTAFDDRVEFDPGINLGGAIGYDYGTIRLEGELSYKQADIKGVTSLADGFRFGNPDGSLGALAMMVNAFFDLHTGSTVTPYFGGGIGFAVLRLSDTFATDIVGGTPQRVLLYAADDDTVLAYQAGVGLEIALNRQLSLDLGYRFFGTSKARFDADPVRSTTLKFESHNALVGLRMKF
jgi:opacity protein-like surface antigen